MTIIKLYVTVRNSENPPRKPASVSLNQRFQIQVATNDHTMELQRIWHFGRAMTQTIRLSIFRDGKAAKAEKPEDQIKWAKGSSNFPKSKRSEENCRYPVFYRHENSAFKSQSTNGPMWPSMTNLKVLQRPCESCWTALLNCYGQSLVPTSNGATWPRVVSTMIWQTFETNISSNLHISILDLDFSLVGPRPLYSIPGNEESRIFGSC